MMSRSRSKVLMIFGLFVSIAFVSYSLYHLDWPVFAGAFSRINAGWLVLCVLTLLSTMMLRALRWHMIAGIPACGWAEVWKACGFGYAGTAILPARAGEVMRVVYLQRSGVASTGLAIGSSLLDRLVDAIALCFMIGFGLLAFVSGAVLGSGFLWMTVIVVCFCILIVSFLASGNSVEALIDFLSHRGVIAARLAKWAGEAFSALRPLQTRGYWIRIVSLQVLISMLDVTACWLLMWAFSWHLPVAAAYFTLLCVAVASTLPSTPGYIGVYQVATMTALYPFGVAESEALAYGTLLQICSFVLFLLAGAWAYLRGPRKSPS